MVSLGGVLIFLTAWARRWINQCIARPTGTFPASGHRHSLMMMMIVDLYSALGRAPLLVLL